MTIQVYCPEDPEWETNVSPHLSWAELACKDGTPYPAEWMETIAVELALEFEHVRAMLGHESLEVGSAYRTESHNQVIGGSDKSQHIAGRALDVFPTEITVRDLHVEVCDRARQPDSKIRGIGKYGWGVHLDIRPMREVVRW